mgnify:FL=1|jgi:TRAP-type C4-dicarboxylate transport system substrate-binding protein
MKKNTVVVLMCLVCALISAADKKVELKFAHYLAENHPAHEAALAFANAVKEKTGGTVTVILFPNSMLGNSQELVEQTTTGALDLVIPTEPAIAK